MEATTILTRGEGEIGIATILHERMHQIDRFHEDFGLRSGATQRGSSPCSSTGAHLNLVAGATDTLLRPHEVVDGHPLAGDASSDLAVGAFSVECEPTTGTLRVCER